MEDPLTYVCASPAPAEAAGPQPETTEVDEPVRPGVEEAYAAFDRARAQAAD
ncbi:hypothetical protein ACX6XY_12120 [Streptomyces sp. O3]